MLGRPFRRLTPWPDRVSAPACGFLGRAYAKKQEHRLSFERVLARLIVTPRMHGIHHSDREDETNSNWSSLLSLWDFVHRTFRLDVPDERVVIGVPAYRDPGDVTLGKLLTLPFRRQRRGLVTTYFTRRSVLLLYTASSLPGPASSNVSSYASADGCL